MDNSQRSTEQGRLIYATTALLGWYGFSGGVYAILTGEAVGGLVWFALTASLVAFLLRAKSIGARHNRQVPGLMWGFVGADHPHSQVFLETCALQPGYQSQSASGYTAHWSATGDVFSQEIHT